jgi:glycosyltransferase involved in cell wall biosynthesis
MKSLHYFYRHSHSIYFSIEKLFHEVAGTIRKTERNQFQLEELFLPFTSKLSSIYKNVSFIKRSQGQVNHITGDVHYGILGCSKRNINVLTIHDCVMLYRYKSYDPRYWLIRYLWYQWPVKRATAVTVISENTRRDLLKFTTCDPKKVRVIPNFIDPLYQRAPFVFRKERPTVLFIGTAPNKNWDRLVIALTRMTNGMSGIGMKVMLEIIGYVNEKQMEVLKTSGIAYNIENNLSAEEMYMKYVKADIIAFPSTYEGFGLPILEGQAVGRPVLTSAVSPMMEVAGGGACLVDPYNVDSICEGLVKIIEDDAYRNTIIAEGYKNVERFTLEKVSKQYADLYKELLSNNSKN